MLKVQRIFLALTICVLATISSNLAARTANGFAEVMGVMPPAPVSTRAERGPTPGQTEESQSDSTSTAEDPVPSSIPLPSSASQLPSQSQSSRVESQSTSLACTAESFASVSDASAGEWLLSHSNSDCLSFLFETPFAQQNYNASRYTQVAYLAAEIALDYDDSIKVANLFIYLRAAWFLEFASPGLIGGVDRSMQIATNEALTAYAEIPEFFTTESAEHGRLLLEWILTADANESWAEYYGTIIELMETRSAYRLREHWYQQSYRALLTFILRAQVENVAGSQQLVCGDPALPASLQTFILDSSAAALIPDIVSEYTVELGRLLNCAEPLPETAAAIQNVLDGTTRLSRNWLSLVAAVDSSGADCADYSDNICRTTELVEEVATVAFPNTYEFDNGSIVFYTPLDFDEVEQLYYQVKEVRATFFKLTGVTEAVPGDTNEVAHIRIYGSPSDYQAFQFFLYGLPSNNGGIYIESDGTLYTFDRTSQDSFLTLEELVRHEYAHYLVGRYLVPNLFGEGELYADNDFVWFEEGFANLVAGGTQHDGIFPLQSSLNWIAGRSPHYTPAEAVETDYSDPFLYPYSGLILNYEYDNGTGLFERLTDALRVLDVAAFDAEHDRISAVPAEKFSDYINNWVENFDSVPTPWQPYPGTSELPSQIAADIESEFISVVPDQIDGVTCSDESDTWYSCNMMLSYNVEQTLVPQYELTDQINVLTETLNASANNNLKTATCYALDTHVDSCGNGNLEIGEACDDGNRIDGDGCNSLCSSTTSTSEITCPTTLYISPFGNWEHGYIYFPGDPTVHENACVNPGASCDGIYIGAPIAAHRQTATCIDGFWLPNALAPEFCGDGTQNTWESCDDANQAAGDGCSSVCRLEACGNGFVDQGETCDDGNILDGDGCSSSCLLGGCGNGSLDSTETCDDGNLFSGDGCSSTCNLEVCGNGFLDPGESCDASAGIGVSVCDGDCQRTAYPVRCEGALAEGSTSNPKVNVCGDGILAADKGEFCDDGNTVATCLIEECGNGIVDDGELCDDGDIINGDGCSATCQTEICGNGIVDEGELCDDGNAIGDDGCSSTCQTEVCGNGTQDPSELCDDGNTEAGDGCNSVCVEEICGNDILDAGEFCDDGNTINADGCSNTCEMEICGNNVLDAGETCDDGNTEAGDGCNSTCQIEGCGNGILDAGELCDDENLVDGDGCSASCQTEVCGNGTVDSGELCDDSNTAAGDGCSETCQTEICGNTITDAGEACDDGNTVSGDGCNASCQTEICGNDIVDAGELCDDGNSIAGDGCSDTCQVEACGNNVLDAGEICDDGNTVAGDGCNTVCESEACGNGVVDAGELCDDGNILFGDGCSATCQTEICGNSIIDEGEMCDDGNNIAADGCNETCQTEICGNNVVDAGEQCDDGNATGGDDCSASCQIEVCGNNVVDAGELCDDGNTEAGDGCNAVCDLEACGNGITDAGELCDDGNDILGDGCNATCQTEVCGNSTVDSGELCDDGNLLAGDGCDTTCQTEVCGNSIVDAGELCDDGNTDNGDACNATCQTEVCGNSTVDADELCDDGNTDAGDGCSATCQTEVCGNGAVDAGELCDDGNTDAGDGCSASCQTEVCGNNIVDAGELCDDGNAEVGDGCNGSCQIEVCGNDVLDAGELCDDGNTDAGDGCSATCQTEVCGNNVVDAGEFCDDGNAEVGDGCNTSCQIEICGNGTVDAGEVCDDGNTDIGDGCNATCQKEICGNEIVDAGELCDDGNTEAGDGCNSVCQTEVCGNDTLDIGEQCDDGNTIDGDSCDASCEIEPSECPGVFNPGAGMMQLSSGGMVANSCMPTGNSCVMKLTCLQPVSTARGK